MRCLCCGPRIGRRGFLGGAAALAVTGLAPTAFAAAKPRFIDVHAHIAPPSWRAEMEKIGRGDLAPKSWSVAGMIADMDRDGVATSMTSPTAPQVVPLAKESAVKVAREANEFAVGMMMDNPGRFGVWATLPLPHLDESLKEIAYAFDVLKADGIGCLTSYGDKWLGDAAFAPVWEELNRRKATVYTHPTVANCCVNLVPDVPSSVVEYGADTTRAIASVILSGTTRKYPDINWIWSHGGGVLTAVAERFQWQLVNTPPTKGKFTREEIDALLRRFYYDTAAISGAVTLSALKELVSASQILFGTDYPYRTAGDHAKGVAATFKGGDFAKVERGNALKLVRRLEQN